MNIYKQKLLKIFNECDKHIIRIQSASTKMQSIMPLDKDKYLNLSDDEVESIDQFLFRFSKLQDAIEEKLELLVDVNIWRELRDDRNDLAHNYDDDPEETSEVINKLYYKKDILIDIYQTIKSKTQL
ncbi:hypothetical protein [Sulfurimonas sp.]|uniref:hypothetical protein n=1 Tax=Sulfurimonas sp. TaxID=2022749 RepID=UPI0026384A5D|nr:hypothetical protein [Sulfurimonas sp.]